MSVKFYTVDWDEESNEYLGEWRDGRITDDPEGTIERLLDTTWRGEEVTTDTLLSRFDGPYLFAVSGPDELPVEAEAGGREMASTVPPNAKSIPNPGSAPAGTNVVQGPRGGWYYVPEAPGASASPAAAQTTGFTAEGKEDALEDLAVQFEQVPTSASVWASIKDRKFKAAFNQEVKERGGPVEVDAQDILEAVSNAVTVLPADEIVPALVALSEELYKKGYLPPVPEGAVGDAGEVDLPDESVAFEDGLDELLNLNYEFERTRADVLGRYLRDRLDYKHVDMIHADVESQRDFGLALERADRMGLLDRNVVKFVSRNSTQKMGQAYGYFRHDDKGIYFNPNFDNEAISAWHDGGMTAASNVAGIFFHELAHALHNDRLEDRGIDGRFTFEHVADSDSEFAREVRRDISTYAMSNTGEFVAEMFVAKLKGIDIGPRLELAYEKNYGPEVTDEMREAVSGMELADADVPEGLAPIPEDLPDELADSIRARLASLDGDTEREMASQVPANARSIPSPSKAPAGTSVVQGPRGGWYYVPASPGATEGTTDGTVDPRTGLVRHHVIDERFESIVANHDSEDAMATSAAFIAEVVEDYRAADEDPAILAALEQYQEYIESTRLEDAQDAFFLLHRAVERHIKEDWKRRFALRIAVAAIENKFNDSELGRLSNEYADQPLAAFAEYVSEQGATYSYYEQVAEHIFQTRTGATAKDGASPTRDWVNTLAVADSIVSQMSAAGGGVRLSGVNEEVPRNIFDSIKGVYNWLDQDIGLNPRRAYDPEEEQENYDEHESSTPYQYHTIIHEMGHAAHAHLTADAWDTQYGDIEAPGAREALTNIMEGMNEWESREDEFVAGTVSRYAQLNPAEFVAEYFAARLYDQNNEMDELYDDELVELYERLNGPPIPEGVALPGERGEP